MTVRNKDNTEERRVVVHEKKSLENHPHLISSVQRKITTATINFWNVNSKILWFIHIFPKTLYRLIKKNAIVSSFFFFNLRWLGPIFLISASSHTCNYIFFTILKGNTDTCTYHLKLTPISLRLFQAHRYYSDIDKVWLLKSNLTGVDGNWNRSSTSNS